MKRLVFIVLLLGVVGGFASAQSQWDLTLMVPYYNGLRMADGTVGEFASYAFVIPEVKWNYYFGAEWLRFGLGLKMWTALVISGITPIISLESNLNNFIINLNVAGGLFGFFGFVNYFLMDPIFVPELSLAYRFGKNKIFSLGLGALFFIAPFTSNLDIFSFSGTAFARWTF